MHKFLFVLLLNLSACSGNLGDCDPTLPMSQCPNYLCYTPAGCSENPADTSEQFGIPVNTTLAYGPFVLPIHNNNVVIFGGAWNYSSGCVVTSTHSGFDFDGNEGDPIYAAATGTVSDVRSYSTFAQCDTDPWGCYVDIDHDVDGDGTPDYTTKYAHLREDSITVEYDQEVTTNTIIGQMGNTGLSSGAHLHFGVQLPGSCQSLAHSCWLDPYNLYGNATCCDIPNGCPNEGTSSQHPDFDCDAASDPNYLWASCPPTYDSITEETPTPTPTSITHLMTVEPNGSAAECAAANDSSDDVCKFSLYGYEVSGSGDSTALTGPFFSYIDTGNTTTIVAWLSGEVNGDEYDDVVQVRATNGYTYAQVYLANGEGGLNTQTRWKKTPGTATHAFLGDIDGDDKDDLILVFANTDSTLTWKYFVSSGTGFNTAQPWHSGFGYTVSELVVGDFNGNGQVEAFNGTPGTNNVLTWQRLNGSGTINNISTTFGLSSDELIVADSDNDGSDEIIRLDERNSSVECEAAHYHNSSSSFTTTTCGTDVGGTSGDYAIYLLDSTGTYPDLIRSNGTTLYLASGNGTSFEEQSDQHDMVSGLNLADSQSTFLLGNFGTRTSTTGLSIDGDLVDPLDEDDEEPTPPDDDDTGDDDDATEEPTPSCNNDGDGQTATSCGGTDCNDSNATIYYGAPELCGNGIDDDCIGGDVPCSELYCTDNADNDLDGLVDCNDSDCASNSACAPPAPDHDLDNDGQDAVAYGGQDCNDSNASVYYGAPEICGNGIDNDCVGGDVPCSELYCSDGADNDLDGAIDCADSNCASNSACAPIPPPCDNDGDGQTATSCGGTDCNDSNGTIYYGAPELCGNSIDDDCVGGDVPCSELYCTDNADNDLDGLVDCNDPDCSSSSACSTPTPVDYDGDGYPDSSDCGWWSANIYPGAPELADWVDNDCDGTTDDGCNDNCNNVYWNGCSDDYAAYYATNSLTYICTGSSSTGSDTDGDGYPDSSDCAWWDATTYPGAPERSDWNDNDCDGTTDEGCDGSCGGNYSGGCHDDYEWWYLSTASSAPICWP